MVQTEGRGRVLLIYMYQFFDHPLKRSSLVWNSSNSVAVLQAEHRGSFHPHRVRCKPFPMSPWSKRPSCQPHKNRSPHHPRLHSAGRRTASGLSQTLVKGALGAHFDDTTRHWAVNRPRPGPPGRWRVGRSPPTTPPPDARCGPQPGIRPRPS